MSKHKEFKKSAASGDELDITSEYSYLTPKDQEKIFTKTETQPVISPANKLVRRISKYPDANAELDAITARLLSPVRYHEASKKYEKMLKEQERELRLEAFRTTPFARCSPIPPVRELAEWLDPSRLPWELREAATNLAAYLGVELEAALLAILTTMPMALRGRVLIAVNDTWTEAAEIFTLLIRRSGGKKSEFARVLAQPFRKFEQELQLTVKENERLQRRNKRLLMAEKSFVRGEFSKHFPRGRADLANEDDPFEERLERFLGDGESISCIMRTKESPEKTAPSLFFASMTAKKLIRKLNEQGGSLACIEAEGTIFTSEIMRKHKQFLLSAHDMERISDASLTSGEAIVPHPAISMLLMVQPSIASKFYRDASAKEVGLSPRFLPFFSSRKTENSGDSEAFHRFNTIYSEKLMSLLARYFTQDKDRKIHILRVSTEAYKLLKRVDTSVTVKHAFKRRDFMESFESKSRGHVVRLAAAIHTFCHANEDVHDTEISQDEMQAAISLFRVLDAHAEEAFDEHGFRAYQNALCIIRWLLRASPGAEVFELTTREIQQGTHIRKEEAEAALRILQANGLCLTYVEPGKSTIVMLNRHFFELPWDDSLRTISSETTG